jgi:hypothetical protein
MMKVRIKIIMILLQSLPVETVGVKENSHLVKTASRSTIEITEITKVAIRKILQNS